jgi:hypothetical protein
MREAGLGPCVYFGNRRLFPFTLEVSESQQHKQRLANKGGQSLYSKIELSLETPLMPNKEVPKMLKRQCSKECHMS